MSIKLEMMRVFLETAQQGTLAGAAARLRRTPSAVSMTLGQLETEIGAPLFQTDRKSRLTPLGHLVLEESQRATEAFDRSVDAIRRHAMSTAGIVRIAAVPSATVTLLPDAIEGFRAQFPQVRIEISDVDSATVRRRIGRDEADIGIVSALPGDPPEGVRIQTDDLGIVCAEGGPVHVAHLKTSGKSDWGLLGLEPLITNPLCALVDDPAIAGLCLSSTLEARNTTAILSFVRRGFGASILPYEAVRNQPDGVEFFVPAAAICQRQLRGIRSQNSPLSGPARAFLSLLCG